ncbi:MAG: SusD/RagB family nutrient-binding outer membrane lipoprotein [Candidatus Cryptobacteroides sp.]
MKNIIKISLLAASLTLASCNGWLDVNDNPNYVADASVETLLPSAQLVTVSQLGGDLTMVGDFWAQYATHNKTTNQYITVMNYDLTVSSSYFIRPWRNIYSRVLPTLKTIIGKCADGGYSNFELEAKTMIAYNMYLLTSLYGDVAWTEGPLAETYSEQPHFDTPEQVQEMLIAYLEEVRAMDSATAAADELTHPSAGSDMIFAGDVDAWLQFANTIYLKVLIRDFDANKTKIEALLAEDNFLAADAAFDHFLDAADKSNPLYENDRRMLNTPDNIRACSDILGVLSANDPRLGFYFEGALAGDAPYGQLVDPAVAPRFAIAATDPVYFGTVDEVFFLKAEVYARLGNAASAKACYDAALEAAFARTGYADAAAGFIAGDYAFAAGSAEAMVEQIINHKWASMPRCMSLEAWFDINRTGYPTRGTTITLYNGVIDSPAVRFLIPDSSSIYNENAPEVKPLTEKLWWHK